MTSPPHDPDTSFDHPLSAKDIPAYVQARVPILSVQLKTETGPTEISPETAQDRLDAVAHWVHDADEEYSGLYMLTESGRGGLGYVPIMSDLLYLHVACRNPARIPPDGTRPTQKNLPPPASSSTAAAAYPRRKFLRNRKKSNRYGPTSKVEPASEPAPVFESELEPEPEPEPDCTPGPGEFALAAGITARAGTAEETEDVHSLLAQPHSRLRDPLAEQRHRKRQDRVPTARKGKTRSQRSAHAVTGPTAPFAALVLQNQTHLRSSAGDTGSVVWRSTVQLAATLARPCSSTRHFLDLTSCPLRILELGSGTGVFPLLLQAAHLLAPGSTWLATDQEAILPLLTKNVYLAQTLRPEVRICADALDWEETAAQLGRSDRRAQRYRDQLWAPWSHSSTTIDEKEEEEATVLGPDVVLAVDVVYNESLFPALLGALTYVCVPGQTVVFVLLELRQADMVREFLAQWLAWDKVHPSFEGAWRIVCLEPGTLAGAGLDHDVAAFVAWRA